jgi:hypothetical protein
MLYLNLLVGAAGVTIYGLWAGKWWHRKVYDLFALNLASGLIVLAFVAGYTAIAIDPTSTFFVQPGFRMLFPFLIGGPVVARILEYRRDQQREEYHNLIAHHLMQEQDGVA